MQVDHNSPAAHSKDIIRRLILGKPSSKVKVRYASCSTVLNGKYYVMGGRIGDGSVGFMTQKLLLVGRSADA